jgi:hypothetical protein
VPNAPNSRTDCPQNDVFPQLNFSNMIGVISESIEPLHDVNATFTTCGDS